MTKPVEISKLDSKETEEVAYKRAKELGPFIANLKRNGSSYEEIALHMNKIKTPPPFGKSKWYGVIAREYHLRAIVLAGPVSKAKLRQAGRD